MAYLRAIIFYIGAGMAGLYGGALSGFYGLFWLAQYCDKVHPEAKGGFVATGWVFLYITIPLGALIGCFCSIFIFWYFFRRRR